jgi:uncharacterized protein
VRVRLLIAWLSVWAVWPAAAVLPPVPTDYVLDEAGVFAPAQKEALAAKLQQFERETSEQLLVAVIPSVPEGEVLEDFTQRTAEAWGVGRRATDNGMVLFVFPESRAMRIEVGYGLEGAVPDALANRIIEDDIVPSFRAGDLPGGIEKGVEALMAAARGEYVAVEGGDDGGDLWVVVLFFIIFALIVIWSQRAPQGGGGTVYTPAGRREVRIPSGGGFGGGMGSGGGGFSGGGGRFGGGGASGRW